MKNTNHRVLFQNSDGNINMGIWLSDPDIQDYDIYWLNIIAREIKLSLIKENGHAVVNKKLNIRSCYVELLRIGIKDVEINPYIYFKFQFQSPSWFEWSKSYNFADAIRIPSG